MKLKVVSEYRNARERFTAGQVIDVTEAQADWFKHDAPGCFEDYAEPTPEPADKAPSAPEQNKMIGAAPKRK